MPDRPLQVAAYAAGASLAAATLVYVFAPTFFLDEAASQSTRSTRKRGVVGLSNPANDCFINSVLQVLAGLPELRLHLIRETHLRSLGGEDVYGALPAAQSGGSVSQAQNEKESDQVAPFRDHDDEFGKGKQRLPDWKVLGLQRGEVTIVLKEMLDALNERPIYKKTLSAQVFVEGLQKAFRTRINRSQQDAQEFLQLVTERLWEEYRAGRAARWRAREAGRKGSGIEEKDMDGALAKEGEVEGLRDQHGAEQRSGSTAVPTGEEKQEEEDNAAGQPRFPFEGKIESQIECLHCHFKPRPSVSSFVTLTLHAPHGSSETTLSACFDGLLKIEHIDDFRCAYCRIQHAIDTCKAQRSQTTDEAKIKSLEHDLALLEECLAKDPEKPPEGVQLPESSLAPQRKIARHSRISSFPSVLAIHLSRSVWDHGYSSTKNHARVSFPESLPLGGLLDHVTFRLLGLVTHKGVHNSGHYESFRRQFLREAYSTPTTMGTAGAYSKLPSPAVSGMSSPALNGVTSSTSLTTGMSPPIAQSEQQSRPSDATESSASLASRTSTTSAPDAGTTSGTSLDTLPRSLTVPDTTSAPIKTKGSAKELRKKPSLSNSAVNLARRTTARPKKEAAARWWRISDDRIKECSTKDVLRMEKEVYLLFYELVPGQTG